MAILQIPMPLNLVVRQNLWASVPYIDVQTGVKHGNLADNPVEKSGHPPAILGVRMPGCPLILYTDIGSSGLKVTGHRNVIRGQKVIFI